MEPPNVQQSKLMTIFLNSSINSPHFKQDVTILQLGLVYQSITTHAPDSIHLIAFCIIFCRDIDNVQHLGWTQLSNNVLFTDAAFIKDLQIDKYISTFWHISSISLYTGRGIGTETCWVDNVLPPGDLWFGSDANKNYTFICYQYMHLDV